MFRKETSVPRPRRVLSIWTHTECMAWRIAHKISLQTHITNSHLPVQSQHVSYEHTFPHPDSSPSPTLWNHGRCYRRRAHTHSPASQARVNPPPKTLPLLALSPCTHSLQHHHLNRNSSRPLFFCQTSPYICLPHIQLGSRSHASPTIAHPARACVYSHMQSHASYTRIYRKQLTQFTNMCIRLAFVQSASEFARAT
jgi:hypothetical protein